MQDALRQRLVLLFLITGSLGFNIGFSVRLSAPEGESLQDALLHLEDVEQVGGHLAHEVLQVEEAVEERVVGEHLGEG